MAIAEDGDQIAATIDDGDAILVDLTASGVPGQFSLIVEGRPWRAYVSRAGETLRVTVAGRTYQLDPVRGSGRGRVGMTALNPAGQVQAIAGVVIDVRVKVGDRIAAGQTIAVIEAMKMQNEVQAPLDGTVTVVHAVTGERIEAGALVIEYEPDEQPEA